LLFLIIDEHLPLESTTNHQHYINHITSTISAARLPLEGNPRRWQVKMCAKLRVNAEEKAFDKSVDDSLPPSSQRQNDD